MYISSFPRLKNGRNVPSFSQYLPQTHIKPCEQAKWMPDNSSFVVFFMSLWVCIHAWKVSLTTVGIEPATFGTWSKIKNIIFTWVHNIKTHKKPSFAHNFVAWLNLTKIKHPANV
jgi:hypothetical protein